MSAVPKPLPGTLRDPLYPDSDGREMGETDFHTVAVIHLREALEDLFRSRGVTDAYVASQLLLYYQRGNPSGRRDPDVMVGLGAGSHQRRSWRVWEEGGRLPDVVFEISSENTVNEDTGAKRMLYERLGIPEYFLFDPEDRFLRPPLQGFRLIGGAYQAVTPGAGGSLDSVGLNVRLEPHGHLLRVVDLTTGVMVPTRRELVEQAQEQAEHAQEQLEQTQERLTQAVERAEKLLAEIDRLKAQLGSPPAPP